MVNNIKVLIQICIVSYKGRSIYNKIILDFIQTDDKEEDQKPFKYYEVKKWMIYYKNYLWRNASVRSLHSLRVGLEERIIFK